MAGGHSIITNTKYTLRPVEQKIPTPQNVIENNTHKLYRNRYIITDTTVFHNKPNIALTNKTRSHT